MKTINNNTKINFKSLLKVMSIMILGALMVAPLYGQAFLYGPQTPPPKESSITTSHPESTGQIGRAGGMEYTITNITLGNTTTVYWTMLADAVKLSMDGSTYVGAENMLFNAAMSNLAGGVIVWTGATQMPLAAGGSVSLTSKFVMTVYDQSSNPIALVDPTVTGLGTETGGAVLISANTMVVKVRMEMLVSDNGGTTYTPHLDYYDPAPTPAGAESAYSTYGYGFYWENDPPSLKTNLNVSVDEGDTVIITTTSLAAEDVESTPEELRFVVDPSGDGIFPSHGKVQFDGVDIVVPDTFSMADLTAGAVSYVHDGSESLNDFIRLMIIDSDNARYRYGADSVFSLVLNITPVDDPPVVEINAGAVLDEGAEIVITEAMLLTTDAESDPDVITYTVDPASESDFPKGGLLKLNDIPVSDGGTFTQADIASGLLKYKHDGSETLSDGFLFRVADENGHPATKNNDPDFFFSITANQINDPPVFTKNIPVSVDEGGIATISNANIAASDEESGPEGILFTLDPNTEIDQPIHGQVLLGTVVLGDGDSFTMSDVNNNLVKYQHDGSEDSYDFIPFRISDPDGGVAMDGEFDVFQLGVNISPTNDAPTVANPIEDQQTRAGEAFSFTFAENTFNDVDADDVLSYTSLLDDESGLPGWLSFDGPSRTFSGTPPVEEKGMNYAIVVTATDLAFEEVTDDFTLEITSPVGFENGISNQGLTVYPNPFTERLNIEISDSYQNPVSVTIINLLGEKVVELVEKPGSRKTLDLRGKPAGIYFIRIDDGNSAKSLKVVKR